MSGKWGTAIENRNEPVTIDGVTKPLIEWAKQIGMSNYGFRSRIKRGLKGAELLAPHKTHNSGKKDNWRTGTKITKQDLQPQAACDPVPAK